MILVIFVVAIALALLVGKRLDAVWAGGEGTGPQHEATLLYQNTLESDLPHATLLPASLSRGETIATDASTFATYALNDCTVSLAENTSLTLQDGREHHNEFTILTGRVVASGDCVFLTRETEVSVAGTATLVHFSWLDELIVKVIDGGTVIDQSGSTVFLVAEDTAVRFFTLPSVSRSEETDFSLKENETTAAFYTWSLPNE